MRVRALSITGDYTFGQGEANFLINTPAAVGQMVLTGLELMEGTWFLDVTAGTPWTQDIIGTGTQQIYDLAIQNQILNTIGVLSIESYSSIFTAKTRNLAIEATINTQYGPTTISTSLSIP